VEVALVELSAADAVRYNTLIHDGAHRHGRTLRIAPEDLIAAPFSTGRLEDAVTLLARADDGRWLGVGTVERERGRLKRRHVAWIVRMLVIEPGRGIGRSILRGLKSRAQQMPGVAKVNLTVAADNAAAVRLYGSEGFVEFSREPDAFRHGSDGVTELTMAWAIER
jgi:GNAT superfamily N-acetyltransferase